MASTSRRPAAEVAGLGATAARITRVVEVVGILEDAPEGVVAHPGKGSTEGVRSYDVGPPVESDELRVVARDRRRDETRDRTRDLIGRLADASPVERVAIRDEVVTMHLWIALSLARRYGPRTELDDMVQVARVGLIEAFDRYTPGHTTYSTFAWITADGLLRRYLRDHGWSVRPPRSLQESANKLRKAMPELTQDLGRAPTTADAAEHLGWTQSAVRDARLANHGLSATSIDSLVGDSWVPEQAAEWDAVEARVIIERAMSALSDDERDLVRLRFEDELAQAQIGAVLGMNQMGVSRRLTRVMHKLRREIGDLDGETKQPVG